MSDYYYSFKEKGFFYQPDTESDNYPDDLISLTDVQYHELMQGQAEGKYIEHKKDGPTLVDYPDQSLEDARKQKHAEINRWRDIQENGSVTFTWNNHSWDASKASQDRLAPVLIVAKSSQLPPGFFWTDASNEDVPVTVDDLLAIDAGMTQVMVVQGFKIHEHQRQMKKDISELTKVSDILNYPVGWSDNSGN
ncbi:DUF4376 domain-containing protein [Salmonella enterica]|nr:DUF4376 domain-containing protein [Salmonella enterica]EEJ8294901.1 DUF4376 domain-containing protein [Salmonella enterica]ELV2364734.1 DUF4376 domain-containing protein [Salmonella enterica]